MSTPLSQTQHIPFEACGYPPSADLEGFFEHRVHYSDGREEVWPIPNQITIGPDAYHLRPNGARISTEAAVDNTDIGTRAIVDHDAVLVNSHIGPRAYVGQGSAITDSEVGADTRIGNDVTLTRSQIGSASSIGARSSVIAGLIGNQVNVGLEVTIDATGNVEVGDGATIYPGARLTTAVRVGKRATVMTGAKVVTDIPEGALAIPDKITTIVRGNRTWDMNAGWFKRLFCR